MPSFRPWPPEVSLDPPLVLWSLARTAPSVNDFLVASHFAINVLGSDQHGLSGHFARPAADKFVGIEHVEATAGVPLLDGAIATLVCRNLTQYEGGDHLIFLGEIEHWRRTAGLPRRAIPGRHRAPRTRPLSLLPLTTTLGALHEQHP